MAAPSSPNAHLLIRATHNRIVRHEARRLWDAIRQNPPHGQYTIELRRKEDRPARQATLTVRYQTLEVQPPRNHPRRRDGNPGVKTTWRGLRRLSDIASAWQLARGPSPT